MTQPVRNGDNRRPLGIGLIVVLAVCLGAPFVALLWVGSYTRVEPRLWGFPFFYWYQFLWVFLTAGLTYLAYRLLQSARGPRGGDGPGGAGGGSADGPTDLTDAADSPDGSTTQEVPL